MKSDKQKIGIVVLVALVAVCSYFIAGTYAKYTSTISGSDTATVAKWAWTINNSVIDSAEDAANGFTFDLFNTITDSDIESAETDVASGVIAPGTSGSFDIEITNGSEVNATYAISLAETNASGIPIEYSSDGTNWVSGVNSFNVNATEIDMGDTATTTVYWRWAFTGAQSTNYQSTQTDASDTALGFSANSNPAPSVQVTATVTVTQVD